MAGLSQLYPITRQAFATGTNWLSLTPQLLIMASGYTPNFANQYYSDLNSAYILAQSPTITNLTAVNGYCGGSTVSFGMISSPTLAGSIVMFNQTGVPTTSSLIAYFDTPDLPGMPQVLTGLEFFFYQNITYGGWFRL